MHIILSKNRFCIPAVLVFLLLLCVSCAPQPTSDIDVDTIIVSAKMDPYFPLAQEIAQAEGLGIAADIEEAVYANPRYILLVAAPENITDGALVEIGRLFQRQGVYPALGIITGSTIEKARQLWARSDQAQSGSNFVAGDVEVYQRFTGPIIFDISGSEGEATSTSLDKDGLISALKQADYLYWSRHAGKTSWFWNSESENFSEADELRAQDVPALKPVVIYTPSCSTIRLGTENSIAMAFIDNGAAAYIGNANSPIANSFIRHGLQVPGITSWKEFPLGIVAQVHGKMTARAIFTSPQFYMLGDPRTYLSKEQPYRIISDSVKENGQRVIQGESDFSGSLAIKIADGAAYDFLSVKGVSAASEGDLFYNSKLQTINLGADKYLLLLHEGGSFEIALSPRAPFLWVVRDALWDAFDFSWVLLWLDLNIVNSFFVYLLPAALFIILLLVKVLRQKKPLSDYRYVFLSAFVVILLRLVYFLARWDDYSVSGNYADYTAGHIALGIAGEFACVSAGLMLLKDARRMWGRIFGMALAVLPQLMLTGFYLAFTTLYNILTPVTGMTASGLFNYANFWMLALVLLFDIGMIYALYRFVKARPMA